MAQKGDAEEVCCSAKNCGGISRWGVVLQGQSRAQLRTARALLGADQRRRCTVSACCVRNRIGDERHSCARVVKSEVMFGQGTERTGTEVRRQ